MVVIPEGSRMALYGPTALERAMKIQEVILKAMSGEIAWAHAARIIGCTERTVRRWRWRYEHYGYDGLFDHRRQLPSPKRVPLKEAERILRLYRTQYDGFNVKHFYQKAVEHHGVTLSYTWVKQALQAAGLVPKKKPRGRHLRRREPKPCFGEMLHIDGSKHRWLALRPELVMTLIVVVDDATSRLLYAQLWPEETTEAILSALRSVIVELGLFMALYNDRAGWAFHTPKEQGKVSKTVFTQVGRALDRLGIEHIPAYSPQARGRSERANRTLQDRLVNELKAAGIRDVAEANRFIRETYLPEHNRNFAREPADPASCFVGVAGIELDDILCVEEQRTVGNDNVVRYDNKHLQIGKQRERATCKGLKVQVRQHLDGTISVVRGVKVLGRFTADGLPLEHSPPRTQRTGRRGRTHEVAAA
jgi:transposase